MTSSDASPTHSARRARGRVLFLSHTHAYGPFRVGSHHYASALARSGAEVVHLSTPISLAHRVTGRVSRAAADAAPTKPMTDADGVIHLVPRTVLPRPLGRFRVASELLHHGIDPAFDTVLIDQPLLWDDSVRALGRQLVYRPTDLYPGGVKARAQSRILAAADGVIATSDGVLQGLGSISVPALVLENGVDAEHFAPLDLGERSPVCVYVGALDARFDWDQVDAWARSHPDVRFVIAGPAPAPPPAVAENVELLGPVDFDALPRLLHEARVGLLPLSDNPLNSARSPMKLYEYLAAGLTVVARDTDVIQSDPASGIITYTEPGGASVALDRALQSHSPNWMGIEHAGTKSWRGKADSALAFLRALPRRSD